MERTLIRGVLTLVAAGWLVVGHALGSAADQDPASGTAAESRTAASPTEAAGPTAPRQQQSDADDSATLVHPGGKVRVHTKAPGEDEEELQGTLVGGDDSSFRVRDEDEDRVVTVRRSSVLRIEVASEKLAPTSNKRIAAGTGIGAASGLGAGALLGFIYIGGVSGDADREPVAKVIMGAGVVVGAALGGMIAHRTRGPAWTHVAPDRVRVSIAPTARRGVKVALAVRF